MSENSVPLTLMPGGRRFEAQLGGSLHDALVRAGINIASACGARGGCGKCRVRIKGSLPPPDEHELRHLSANDIKSGLRLACRIFPVAPLEVEVAGHTTGAMSLTVIPEKRTHANEKCAAAVDIGTTGVKVQLISLEAEEELTKASLLNPQRVFGHDVMSRIHAAESSNAAEIMTTTIREAIENCIMESLKALGAPISSLARIVISGNTVMQHFLRGLDVTGMGKYPYPSVSLEAWRGNAGELGFLHLKDVPSMCLPSISAYLGGDLVAGLLALGAHRGESDFLLIDIGTNSEIILASGSTIAATSCAAGPALEGMNIHCGMTACPGAIDSVSLNNDAHFTTLEGAPPLGLCGSGIIDLLAELLRVGIVDANGRMSPGDNGRPQNLSGTLSEGLLQRLDKVGKATAFRLVDAILFTQQDVRQVQLAKGAILSGLKTLQDQTEITAKDISRVFIAGEFGLNLKLENLLRLGFLDNFSAASHTFIGNSSIAGAKMIARNPELLADAEAIARRVAAFPLSTHKNYQDIFVRCLRFPEQDTHRQQIQEG